MGMLYSIVPDSLIYPVLLALLLPFMGYTAIWITYGGNAIVFLLGLYLIRSAKNKTGRLSMERMLCLDESIRSNVPVLDISIRSSNTDVTGISSQVHAFLKEQGAGERNAYITALSLEELAADFISHTVESGAKDAGHAIMDIKIFSDEDHLRIIMRNASAPYNPLDFELNDETFAKVGVKLVQKLSRRIDYNYVYRMNIITIDVAK